MVEQGMVERGMGGVMRGRAERAARAERAEREVVMMLVNGCMQVQAMTVLVADTSGMASI
jgi:hypothetical protein